VPIRPLAARSILAAAMRLSSVVTAIRLIHPRSRLRTSRTERR
jgi:hypothetical protein